MSQLWMTLANELIPTLRSGDLAQCDLVICDALSRLSDSPFHTVLELHFSNAPEAVGNYLNQFLQREKARFDVKAVYVETNGFDVNPDLWYFDCFAYKKYGGVADFDWLSDWQSDYFEGLTLSGMESLQEIYASDAFRKPEFHEAIGLCSLLVVVRLQQLLARSVKAITELNTPLLATGHGYDFIVELNH